MIKHISSCHTHSTRGQGQPPPPSFFLQHTYFLILKFSASVSSLRPYDKGRCKDHRKRMVELIFTDRDFLSCLQRWAPMADDVSDGLQGCQFQSLWYPVNYIYVRSYPNQITTLSLFICCVL